jgi:hypothetical protein
MDQKRLKTQDDIYFELILRKWKSFPLKTSFFDLKTRIPRTRIKKTNLHFNV